MSDDTFTASDFTSAESSASSEPAGTTAAPVQSSAPGDPAAQPDGATTPPAASVPDPLSTDPKQTAAGPIPFEVHKTALENARQKAVAEWQQKYGWAERVDPQEFQQIQRIAAKFASGDPIAALNELVAEARKDPAVDAQLRSYHARELARARQAPQAPSGPDLNPIPVQFDNGNTVGMFTADQITALKSQWLDEVRQEMSPVTQTIKTLQEERAAAVHREQITHFGNHAAREVLTWEGMDSDESKALLAQALGQMHIDPTDPREVMLAAHSAYHRVIAPRRSQLARQAVLNDINRQAAASTVNPAQTSTRAPKSMDEMSIAEALHHVAAQSA